jgi:hypothetical protein
MEKHPNQPAFDWLTFDELQLSMDRTLQESVAFYDPAVQVIVFVFLPSKSGNSVAIWRRKINVPNNTRLILQHEINVAMSGLRRQKDYVVHVNEYVLWRLLHRWRTYVTVVIDYQQRKALPVIDVTNLCLQTI